MQILKLTLFLLVISTTCLSLELDDNKDIYDEFAVSYLDSNEDRWIVSDNKFAFGYYYDDIWIKFKIKNSSHPKEVFVEFSEPFAHILDFYVVEENGLKHYRNGLVVSLHQRDVKTPLPAIKLDFKSKETKEIYIKYRSKFTSYGKISVYDSAAYNTQQIIYTALYFFYFGGIIVIATYNLFLFFALRDKTYIYYVGYALTFTVWVFLYSGFSLYFIDSQLHYKLHFSTPFAFVFFTLFTQSLLETKRFMPKVNSMLHGISLMLLLSCIYVFLNIEQGYFLANKIGIIYFPLLIFVSFLAIQKGVKTAKFYLVSFLIFLFTMSILTNLAMGFVEYSVVAKSSFIVGSMVEIALFSLLLAYRINILKEEKLEAKTRLLDAKKSEALKLEKSVDEKTEDLKVVNKKLKHMIDDRETLLRELHHRVKNNLQTITGMLWIQTKKSLNKEGTKALNELLMRIKSMALVHELLYTSNSTAQISTKDYFEELIDSLLIGMKTKDIEVIKHIEDIDLGIEESISVGTILAEVLTNSLKHAFNNVQRPKLIISVSSSNGRYMLKVADNGCGFEQSEPKCSGFGLKIIDKTLLSLNKSTIKYYKNTEDDMFVFEMEFSR